MKTEKSTDLFSSIKIGELEAKNRIVMPTMILNYPVNRCELDPAWHEFYGGIAAGYAVIQKETTADSIDGDVIIRREDQLTRVPVGSLVFAAGYLYQNR